VSVCLAACATDRIQNHLLYPRATIMGTGEEKFLYGQTDSHSWLLRTRITRMNLVTNKIHTSLLTKTHFPKISGAGTAVRALGILCTGVVCLSF